MNPTNTDKRLAAIHKRLHDYRESTCLPRSEFLENAPADTAYLLDLVSRLTSPTPLSSHDSVSPDSAPGAGDVGGLGTLLAQLGAHLENAARIHDPGGTCRHHLVLDAEGLAVGIKVLLEVF